MRFCIILFLFVSMVSSAQMAPMNEPMVSHDRKIPVNVAYEFYFIHIGAMENAANQCEIQGDPSAIGFRNNIKISTGLSDDEVSAVKAIALKYLMLKSINDNKIKEIRDATIKENWVAYHPDQTTDIPPERTPQKYDRDSLAKLNLIKKKAPSAAIEPYIEPVGSPNYQIAQLVKNNKEIFELAIKNVKNSLSASSFEKLNNSVNARTPFRDQP